MIRINDPSTQFDKLPPQSITAEQCLLASLMLDVDLYEEARERIHSHEAFYLVDHAIIFKILADARERGRPMDAVILREELARRGQLDEIGGTAYLAELLNTVPTAANGLHYADIVADKFRRREIIRAANEAIRSAWAPAEDLEEVERIASTLAMKAECVRDTGGSDPT
ncbi:MAG TPA: DnaB-like helicase N-terminal domain-containing protein, partial [Tepidisphaeraceae bacterium]